MKIGPPVQRPAESPLRMPAERPGCRMEGGVKPHTGTRVPASPPDGQSVGRGAGVAALGLPHG